MDIHHAMMVRNSPDRLFEALTQQRDFEMWMGATTFARPEVGSALEFHFDQGQHLLKMEDVYASVSYKWASFMMRSKIYLGDIR